MADVLNYVELASPNVVNHRWKEVLVDVASAQSTLQDISLPECVGGFSYRDTHTIGSPCYNRYIYWRTANELLEMVELSSEFILTNNQIRIKFTNAPIINTIRVIELNNSLLILIATLSSVHRISLPHPKIQVATQLVSSKQFVANSVFSTITNQLLSDNRTFYVLNGQSANVPAGGASNPKSATSWLDEAPDLASFALTYPNGSIHIVKFNHNIDAPSILEASMNSLKSDSPVTSWELKHTSIIGRIWSRMPALLAKNQHESDDAALSCVAAKFEEGNDMILFALCRDYKLRIWSTRYRELAHSYSLIAQPLNQSLSTSQSRLTLVDLSNQQLLMRVTGTDTKDLMLAIYMTEQEPEFILLQHKSDIDKHSVEEVCILKAPEWDCLIDFAISRTKIWAVALNTDNDYMLYWLNLQQLSGNEPPQNTVDMDEWHSVYLNEDPENLKSARDHQYQIVEEIFWRNKFSMSTILKGISILGRGSSDVKSNQDDIQALVDTAASIIRNNLNEVQQDSKDSDISSAEREAWYKFHTYCLQNHQVANKIIGLLVSEHEETIALLKRGNSSMIIPAPSKSVIEFQGPFAGLCLEEISSNMNSTLRSIMNSLNYISQQIITDDLAITIEQKLLDEPVGVNQFFQDLASSLLDSNRVDMLQLPFISGSNGLSATALKDLYSSVFASLQLICNNLDLTETTKRQDYTKVVTHSVSFHPFLTSNHGIAATFELIKKMVKSRFMLARDLTLLLYLVIAISLKESKKSKILNEGLSKLCEDLYMSSIVSRTTDCLRCYRVLLWISESPIKTSQKEMKLASLSTLQQLSEKFQFIKMFNSRIDAHASSSKRQLQKTNEPSLQRNLLTDFLLNGGLRIAQIGIKKPDSTLSKCDIIADIANSVCRLLWPKSQHQCFAEYLLCSLHQDHLFTYLELLDNWTLTNEHDRYFLKAFNHLLSGEPSRAVVLFNRLSMSMNRKNLIGRFIDLDDCSSVMPTGSNSHDTDQGDKNHANTSLLNASRTSLSANPDDVEITTTLIYKYYENLIQIFKLNDYAEDIITLIKHCIPLLSESPDNSSVAGSCENLATAGQSCCSNDQQRINGLRTQLFKYYLDLDLTEEAYHAFALNTDKQQCRNCLHQFIVYHCERERWQELLLFPFLDLRHEFVQVIEQRASNSDLLGLAKKNFDKPSYYDILYSYWMMECEFKRAASCMYKYAQRLGHEVPGIASVKKQSDCLLIVLNCLRCLDDHQDMFIEVANVNGIPESDEQSHGNMLKRGYDSDIELPASPSNSNAFSQSTLLTSSKFQPNTTTTTTRRPTTIDIKEIEKSYELTKARLILLKKDPNVNTIALSPLKVEETISYLVSSSMYTYGADLAILLKSPLEPVIKGLVEKFITMSRLCPATLAHDHTTRQSLSDCLSISYSCIDISNHLTNSKKSPVDKLWLLIDHYLETYDGVSHMCSDPSFALTYSKATVLMNIVATTLLASGYDIPASLRTRFMNRNSAELLKLLIKYDQLAEAADLCVEMTDLVMEPANLVDCGFNPRPIYLPTHLILLLVEYLNEDATNKEMMDMGYLVNKKLNDYRSCLVTYNANFNPRIH